MLESGAGAGGPWPASARFGPRGLSIGGILAEDLAARYGTPLLVADEEHVGERCRAFARLFPHPLYAVKAFTSGSRALTGRRRPPAPSGSANRGTCAVERTTTGWLRSSAGCVARGAGGWSAATTPPIFGPPRPPG